MDYDPWATKNSDKDADGLNDSWEFANFGDLALADASTDYDNDGVLDADEYLAGTDPKRVDSDGDGMPDGWEMDNGLNPLQNDALNDADGDGATNIAEYIAGTSPTDSGDVANMTVEDFESGDFDLFYWITSDPENWGLSGTRTYSGVFAAESYPISDNQSTTLETIINCNGSPVGFMFNVSSQLSLDKLEFYIDGQMQDEWSGELPYTSATYDVTAGRHGFKWVYTKDDADSAHQDAAWIDYIVFPGVPDSDGDAILDGWEYRYFNALDHDMSDDSDSDGITDGDEYTQGTDPLVPN